MKKYYLKTHELKNYSKILKPYDKIYLSGNVYTARDAAHNLLVNLINNKEELPINLLNACIYYAGPTKTPNHLPCGSIGPTTSSRMDIFTPKLLDMGVSATIGKGDRAKKVYEKIKENESLYLCAIGGGGAIAAKHIKRCEEVAFLNLGCESIKLLEFDNFPLFVGINGLGESIFNA